MPTTITGRGATLTPTTTTPSYWLLPHEEAAADPDTPEAYLLKAGCPSQEVLLALLRRRPMSETMRWWLVRLAGSLSSPWGPNRDLANACVTAAADLPDLSELDLSELARGLSRWGGGFVPAAMALIQHPAATETTAIEVLCFREDAVGNGTELELSVASHGLLAATAVRLVRLEGQLRTTPRDAALSATRTVEELSAAVGEDTAWRRTVARIGPTWCGTRADLLTTALAIAS